MTDIQQWRRMIQPARVRTPAAESEDAEPFTSPTTPRRPLKPKFSCYFTQRSISAGESKTDIPFGDDIFGMKFPCWPVDEPTPSPDVDVLVDSLMRRLMNNPEEGLSARFNSDLMQVFEGFRNMRDEKQDLLASIQHQKDNLLAMERALHHSSEQWRQEEQNYKTEVKRLELILAEGQRGLAEVTIARQESLLRRGKRRGLSVNDTLETIFEFLEKTKRYEDKAWSSQRATMRRRSPSTNPTNVSRAHTTKRPAVNIHQDLPFGSPPLGDASSSLKQDTRRIDRATTKLRPVTPAASVQFEAKSRVPDDTYSNCSGPGDLLPDEASDFDLIEVAGTDNELLSMKRIAHILAKRRHIDPEVLMPTLLDLFAERANDGGRSNSFPDSLGIHPRRPSSAAAERPVHTANLRKNLSLKTKASGFLSKFRPQINVDTSSDARRFSFEAGDVAYATFGATPLETLPPAVRDRLLRKSASLSSMDLGHQRSPMRDPPLSPVAQSPTMPVARPEWVRTPPDYEDGRKPSRIPTPVYRTSSLARPRQERDDSASSLLTAIKHSEEITRRSGSLSSSTYSSPSASRPDLIQGNQGSEMAQGSGQMTAGSNRLLDHTNALRGSAAATAAAKAASASMSSVDHKVSAAKNQFPSVPSSKNSRSSTQSRSNTDMAELRKENDRPMRLANSNGQQSNATR